MSFIKRAQEAAAAAAEQAQQAAGLATRATSDPATQEKLGQQARAAMGAARRGVSTVVERIDPGVLADLIIKSTALQEMTNKALRQKGSPYRIAEISISASIPPAVSFAIQRFGEPEDVVGDSVVSSSELVEQIVESDDLVLALDGTTVDVAAVESPAVHVAPGAMPPSSISDG